MKFKREWYIGGSHKDESCDDVVVKYLTETDGTYIGVQGEKNDKWYYVYIDGQVVEQFDILKDAKDYLRDTGENGKQWYKVELGDDMFRLFEAATEEEAWDIALMVQREYGTDFCELELWEG